MFSVRILEDTVTPHVAQMEQRIDAGSVAAFMAEGPVGEWFAQRMEARFASEGDSASGSWAPLAARTQEIRESQGFGAASPINERWGYLKGWATSGNSDIVSAAGFAHVAFPGATSDQWIIEKVKTAQGGKPGVPARPVMAVDSTDAVAVTEMLGEFLNGHS